jgi:hypothetical protein
MGNRYVRVYNSPENSNVIGFSASASPMPHDNFEGFLTELGYETEKYEGDIERHHNIIKSLGGVSTSYYGIEPPLKDEHIPQLAEWCKEHVYIGNNYGFIIDDRSTEAPMAAFDYRQEDIIAKW